jgi:Putative transposase
LAREQSSFRRNLAVLGALAVQRWFWARYRLYPIVLVIAHTFGGKLNFHPHLHLLVSFGGLRRGSPHWHSVERIDSQEVMELWRFAVTEYVLRGWKLTNQASDSLIRHVPSWIETERARQWNIHLSDAMSKGRFLGYAGRYIRRPPITEKRILGVANGMVNFAGKNTRRHTVDEVSLPVEQFVRVLSQHVPEHYEHSMRYFGLLSPRGKRVPAMPSSNQPQLGNFRRRAPNRIPWAAAITDTLVSTLLWIEVAGH